MTRQQAEDGGEALRQLALDLAPRPAFGRDDFLVSPANARALAMVEAPQRWPQARLALVGPEGAGKTHLVHVWKRRAGAEAVAAATLDPSTAAALAATGAVAVEDCEAMASLVPPARRQAEEGFLHLYNLLGASGGRLLVTGRTAPSEWSVATRDLASRLQSLAVVRIEPPDDMLLSSILLKHFADRQLDVAPGVIAYVVPRIERSFEAAARFASAADRAALERRRRVTRQLASEILRDAAGASDTDGGDDRCAPTS